MKKVKINHPFAAHKLEKLVASTLQQAKTAGADAAAVGLSVGSGFSVQVRVGVVESLQYQQSQGISITVYCGQSQGSASTVDTRPEAVQAAVRAALEIAKHTQADPYNGLADKALLAFDYPDLDVFYPWSITPQAAIELALACEHQAREQDSRISNSEGVAVSTQQAFYVQGNSQGFIGAYPSSYHEMSCALVAGTQQDMQRDYSYTVACDPAQLTSATALADEAVLRTTQRLNSRSLKTCRTPIIFNAETARSLMRHFVNAIQGGALYRQASFLYGQLGQPVFPAWMQISEAPHLLTALGSAPFDSDGVSTRANQFIEDGRLVNYALGVYSGRKLGMPTTGNAGGVHNLIIEPGADDLPALLKKMHRGLLVTELMGQGANITTGDYSRGAAGFWVEQGIVQYPVHQITIAGNLKPMFAQLVAIGNDVDVRGNIRTGSILLEHMTVAGQ